LASMTSANADDFFENTSCLLTIDGSGSWDFQLEADRADVKTSCTAYCICWDPDIRNCNPDTSGFSCTHINL
ncbi:MAG: hypothetical protein KC713_08670, partial [Candidatus Omnitrophica bacterium]|nr:hypothetical protein [Candidatus Omnitrophota bacterium]